MMMTPESTSPTATEPRPRWIAGRHGQSARRFHSRPMAKVSTPVGRMNATSATAAPVRPATCAPTEATIIMFGPGASCPML